MGVMKQWLLEEMDEEDTTDENSDEYIEWLVDEALAREARHDTLAEDKPSPHLVYSDDRRTKPGGSPDDFGPDAA